MYINQPASYLPYIINVNSAPVACRGGGGKGGSTPPQKKKKIQSFEKDEPNSQFHGKYIHNNLTKTRVSLIYKLSGTRD
jgi:hypothetical protein